MSEVHFLERHTIHGLPLGRSDRFEYDFRGPHHVRGLLRPPTPEDLAQNYTADVAHCVVQSTWHVKPNIDAEFKRIENNSLASTADATAPAVFYEGPDGARLSVPGLHAFPDFFQSFSSSVMEELDDATFRLANAVRWRLNHNGHPWPIRHVDLKWSRDQSFWHRYPPYFSVSVEAPSVFVETTPVIRESITHLLDGQIEAPVHHELFRESWSLKSTSPRSSLVIGVAAVEVAVKYCIDRLAPDTRWLIWNTASLSLEKLLTEQLPLLSPPNGIQSSLKPPPQGVLDLLKKAVSIRNRVVHIGEGKLTDLDAMLLAIRDTIWICDYYCGRQWALEHVRSTTRIDMGL